MEIIHLVFPVVVQKGSWELVFHFASNRSSKEQVAEGLTGHRTKKSFERAGNEERNFLYPYFPDNFI